jgi:ubiquinone/menaquinone biosynthesis C-methylase UbiE
MARVDYDKQAAVYDAGRTLPSEAIATWMLVARRHLGESADTILDLGSGTGRFSAALADAFDANLVAVEPSAGMRGQAAGKPHNRVHIVAGNAESLPLPQGSCDAAWLSNVIHHFDDIDASARELRRVVVDGGPVLIRGAFAGRGPIPTLYKFFPATENMIETFPTVPEVFDVFERAGFTNLSTEKVEQLLAHTLSDMVEKTRQRADTTLEKLSDEDFAEGLAKLEEAAKHGDGPVFDSLDLLVLR